MSDRQTFRGSIFWTVNATLTVLAAFLGCPALAVILFEISTRHHADAQTRFGLPGYFAAAFLLAIVAYFPGNLGVPYPTKIEVRGASLTLSAPFKKVVIPASEIGDVDASFFWQGHVVHLTRPRAALTQFVISWYFGGDRRTVIQAIRYAAEHNQERED